MPPPRNIELFNRVVAVTLVKLHDAFPNPIDLCGTDIGATAAEAFTDDANEQFQLIMETADNTIGFLVHEGFIRYESNSRCRDGPQFPESCLTLKGFTLLGQTPGAVDESIERRPFIDQLHDVVEEGAKDSATDIVQSLFAGAIRMGMSAIVMG